MPFFVSQERIDKQADDLRKARAAARAARSQLAAAQEQLAQAGIRHKERAWSGMDYPKILGEAAVLLLNEALIDPKYVDSADGQKKDKTEEQIAAERFTLSGGTIEKTVDGPGHVYGITGTHGELMFVVWPYDVDSDEGHVRLWRPQKNEARGDVYPPLDAVYTHLRPDAEPGEQPVSELDMKAWAGYAETVKTMDPRETIGDDGKSHFDLNLRAMKLRMAQVGHAQMVRYGIHPPDLMEHVSGYMESEMRNSHEETLRMMAGQAAILGSAGEQMQAITQ